MQTIPTFNPELSFPAIKRGTLDTLQVNLGYMCNQKCVHCHVDAGPHRTEMMDDDNLDLIIEVLKAQNIKTLDLTGGAPELNTGFRSLVIRARALGIKVIDRCNLTILFEPGQDGLAEFLAENQVEVVASLPCYSLDNVDKQRGKGVFDKSIAGLQKFNALGYGKPDSDLVLNLVYNPQGPSLPPSQTALEADYKRELKASFDIEFNQLFALTNMPVNRFAKYLKAKKQLEPYMALLKNSFSDENLKNVMCTNLVSVDWQGELFDCDFNQQLKMPLISHLNSSSKPAKHLRDLLSTNLDSSHIRVADHCFGCTAGQGSSCGGAL